MRPPRPARRQQPQRFLPSLWWVTDAFLPLSYLTSPDRDRLRRGRLMVAASFGFCLIALFFGFQMRWTGSYPLASELVMYTGAVLAIANLFLLRFTRTTALPGALLCLETLSIHAFQAYSDLGLDDPVLLWTLVIPWLAAFLVGPAYGFVFGGLVTLLNTALYLLERNGHAFPNFSSPGDVLFFYLLCASVLAVFLGFLGWLYEGQTLGNMRRAHQELADAHARVKRAQARTTEILESITDGFFALDADWRFTDANRQAEHYLDLRRDELVGRSALDYFSSHLSSDVEGILRQASATGIPVEFETYFAPLDHWFMVHAHPFADGLSVYFSDITERKKYEKGLIRAKEQAEQLAEIKSNLLANMSHEIRTPLTSVIGFSSILEQEALGEHREFAQLIGQNGRRLMETLNSVLDLAKLERGAVEVHAAPTDVGAEVNEVVSMLRPQAEERGLALHVSVDDPPVTAELDRALLGRVLNNLIGNAIKFTNEGHVAVRLQGEESHLRVSAAPVRRVPPGIHGAVSRLRGQRPRAGDLPAPGRNDGRGDRGGEREGRGDHLHRAAAAPPEPGRPGRLMRATVR